MSITDYLQYAGSNALFSVAILLAAFIPGYFLYARLVVPKVALRDALFEKDNFAAWVELIGAFVAPALYLASKAVEGSASDNLWKDLGICVAFSAASLVLFVLIRLLTGLLVRSFAGADTQGKVTLETEIYGQHNTAAALFSAAMAVAAASVVRFLDFMPGYWEISLQRMALVALFTLVALCASFFWMRRHVSLRKAIFVDNNPAAGLSLLGYMLGVALLLTSTVSMQKEFVLTELAGMMTVSLVLFAVLSTCFRFLFSKLLKTDIYKEVYGDRNVGAALAQAALYVGVASVVVHYLL